MKRLFFIVAMGATIAACNNDKKEKQVTENTNVTTPAENNNTATTEMNVPATGSATVTYSVGDTVRNLSGSILVQKDKEKLSPGNELLAIVTANGHNGESFVINFLFSTKPGTYPVVGYSFTRTNQVFGGILGGKPKLTNYKVNLAECTDLGSNNSGGHKWKLSGSVDEEVTIPAMGIMKMDKNHPESVKVNKIAFSNLTFDDNWEQLLEEGMKKLKLK